MSGWREILGRKRCAARWRANFIGCRALSRTFPMPHHYHAQSSCGFQSNVFLIEEHKNHILIDMISSDPKYVTSHSFRTQITLDCSQDWASQTCIISIPKENIDWGNYSLEHHLSKFVVSCTTGKTQKGFSVLGCLVHRDAALICNYSCLHVEQKKW